MSGRPGPRAALARWIDRLPGGVVFAMALAATAAIGAADESNGSELHLAPLYVGPVAFAAWFLGRAGGLAIALAAAVAWWASETATRPYAPPAGTQLLDVVLELGLLAIVADVVASGRGRAAQAALLGRIDPLTLLANRQGFLEAAQREVARAARTARPLTMVLLDVDRFRQVNDLGGQEEGDALLRRLSTSLRSALRGVDLCARTGGDELAVLLPDPDPTAVEAVLERLRSVLVQASAEAEAPVTVSMGAVTFERPAHTVDEMLRAVRRCLDDVKARGGDGLRHDRVLAEGPAG
ncbi:MAG TPA: GGDEF domain-containing protein [Vicinamibacteria bacterium]|nr:GGDEF domain-containing protein [Vicinamibacteria bacterium]